MFCFNKMAHLVIVPELFRVTWTNGFQSVDWTWKWHCGQLDNQIQCLWISWDKIKLKFYQMRMVTQENHIRNAVYYSIYSISYTFLQNRNHHLVKLWRNFSRMYFKMPNDFRRVWILTSVLSNHIIDISISISIIIYIINIYFNTYFNYSWFYSIINVLKNNSNVSLN